jgi:hypothetical protein
MREEDNNCEVDDFRKRLMCFKVEYMEIDERWIGFKSGDSESLDSDKSDELESESELENDDSDELESDSDKSYEFESESDDSDEFESDSENLESDDIMNGDNIISKKVNKEKKCVGCGGEMVKSKRRVHIGWGNYRWILE